MKKPISILIVLLVLSSCEKEELTPDKNFSTEINFDVSEWILNDKDITCVDFDVDGNAWIVSGNELIFYDNGKTKTYDAGAEIIDLAVAPNRDVWLGTREGLARFSGGHFKFYTEENSGLPRNYTHSVEVAPNGKVWFCSAAHDLGGLMNYDGRRFKLFSPENSILNQHVIQNLKIDKDNNIYFHSQGTVGNTAVFTVSNNGNWEQLGDDAAFYWLISLDVASDSKVYVSTDHSLSSCFGCYTNEILYSQGDKWKVLETPFDLKFLPRFFLDKRDYIWVINSGSDYFSYSVFDGNEWHRSEEGQIPEVFIKSVKVDNQNNIWFCTEEGIFISNQ